MFLPLADVNPTARRPVVTYALIGAIVLAWVFQRFAMVAWGDGAVMAAAALVPRQFGSDPATEWVTLSTSTFMHGGIAHVAGNLLFLYIFGDNVEDALGRARYLGFYLGCGAAAGLAHVYVDPGSAVPLVGASGAVSGVLGAYLVLYPRAPILMFNGLFFPSPLLVFPAWTAIGMWFVLNLLGGLASLGMGHGGGIAHFAHLGGFVAGLLTIRWLMQGRARRGVDPWAGWRPPPSSRWVGPPSSRG